MSYINPTSHNSPGGNWINPDNAIDGNSATFAYDNQFEDESGNTYEALHSSIYCSGIRVRLQNGDNVDWSNDISYIIKVYNGSSWETVREGNLTSNNELYSAEIDLDENKYIEKISIQFTNNSVSKVAREKLYYLQFISIPHPPDVTTTTPPSASDHESATLAGEVTDAYEQAITERGFEYKEGLEGEVSTESEEDTDFGEDTFSLEVTGLKPNTLYYYRAYAVNAGTGYGDWQSFTTDKTTPSVTVQAVTDILPTTATTNGNITCTGGEDCSERGFQYGLTKVATWTVSDIVGGYSAGAFSKGLTDLSANTTYWIRVYAVNTIGTGYSEWLEFQTAAVGIIPTGTKINICSDYSGYTYKLMRSETDDGEEYTAYFVISTDLANKQGLAYYKRILDLELYFNKEDSGTATISVKKDNETTWEELGSVALTGDDDIIIKHLAVDVRAKHYLFKISASNHFEFLGALFQFISSGMR